MGIWAASSENVSSRLCDQVTFKPACSATETSLNLEISDLETRDIILCSERTTKALIRLRECAGWSAPLLFAYGIRQVFAWPGPFVKHLIFYKMSPVKRICVFEHSAMTNLNCACPDIQRGQGSGFLSEGSSWLTARIGDKYQIRLTRSKYFHMFYIIIANNLFKCCDTYLVARIEFFYKYDVLKVRS